MPLADESSQPWRTRFRPLTQTPKYTTSDTTSCRGTSHLTGGYTTCVEVGSGGMKNNVHRPGGAVPRTRTATTGVFPWLVRHRCTLDALSFFRGWVPVHFHDRQKTRRPYTKNGVPATLSTSWLTVCTQSPSSVSHSLLGIIALSTAEVSSFECPRGLLHCAPDGPLLPLPAKRPVAIGGFCC